MRRTRCGNGLVFEIGGLAESGAEQRTLYAPMELCLYFNEGAMLIPLAACSRFPPARRRRRARFSISRLPQTAHGVKPRGVSPRSSRLTNKFALHLCICKF